MGINIGSAPMTYENTNKQTPRPPFVPEAQHEPRRQSRIGTNVNERPEGDAPTERIRGEDFKRPATGPTTRLPTHCRVCGDELPPGATFCIECGEKV